MKKILNFLIIAVCIAALDSCTIDAGIEYEPDEVTDYKNLDWVVVEKYRTGLITNQGWDQIRYCLSLKHGNSVDTGFVCEDAYTHIEVGDIFVFGICEYCGDKH